MKLTKPSVLCIRKSKIFESVCCIKNEVFDSIMKFKDKKIQDEHIMELIEAARLAPSGCNAQPWRFKIVKDKETKRKLVEAAHNQTFIGQAPVVIVCCVDVSDYIGRSASGIQDLGKIGAVEGNILNIIAEM